MEIGGPSYLLPLAQRNKLYDLNNISALIGMDTAFIIGAGAGPFPFVGVSSEVVHIFLIKFKLFAL